MTALQIQYRSLVYMYLGVKALCVGYTTLKPTPFARKFQGASFDIRQAL